MTDWETDWEIVEKQIRFVKSKIRTGGYDLNPDSTYRPGEYQCQYERHLWDFDRRLEKEREKKNGK